MNPTRTIFIACIIGCAGASSAQAASAPAPAPAPAPAASLPTPEEMAPLEIPSDPIKETTFARRLLDACTALKPLTVPAGNDLSGLKAACDAINAGKKLSDGDVASLRTFFNDPAKAEAQIAALAKQAATVAGQGVVTPATVTSAGSLESDIIQGLAQFVYDRAKTEATLYFTKQLSKRLCEGGHELLFPTVCVALAKTTPAIPLGAMGTYLAAAARTDLRQLPDRTLAYELHDLAADSAAAAREPLFGARIALAYYWTVRSGRTPIDVARSLHGIQVSDKVVGHGTEVLKATRVLSELLDAVQAQKGWTEIALGPGNTLTPIVTCYGLGAFFTFEKAYGVDGQPFGPIAADKIAEMIPVVAGYLLDAAALVNRAKLAKSALTAVPATTSTGNFLSPAIPQGAATAASGLTARDYAIVTTQTLEQTLEVGLRIADGLGIEMSAKVKAVVNDVAAVAQIGEQVMNGQSPGDLVIHALGLVQQLTKAAAGSAPPRAVADIQQLLALIAQIAEAKSADEVAAVINAAAAPASTYQLKYENDMVAIGAMAGVSAGYETLRTNGLGRSSAWVVGAFAPVGLTASTPLGTSFHGGLTLSVINLGALVSTRFSEDVKTTTTPANGTTTTTVEAAPQVKLANVLAPGLFFTLGLWKSPFVLALGGQVIPIGRQLSTTAADGTTSTSTTPAIQLVGSLSVDVPILTF